MIDTDLTQHLMLKRIKRANPLSCKNLSEEQFKIIEYLEEHNFIEPLILEGDITSYGNVFIDNSVLTGYKITEAGKAQIWAFSAKFLKWWIPLVISVIALIVSIFK